jgi:hypothetical protein
MTFQWLPFLYLLTLLFTAVDSKRTVMAWANGNPAAALQLRNKSWSNIFSGVQASCGILFHEDGSGLYINQTQWNACKDLQAACRETGATFHVWLGAPPEAAILNPGNVINDALMLAKTYKINGYSIDDETDCAPRSTLDRFSKWMNFINKFSGAMHGDGLTVSAAVQAMFGIQDVPYKPLCKPVEKASCSQACSKGPAAYPLEKAVGTMMSNSSIDRWLEMDTYYFSTGRFLNALDWYTSNVASEKLGVSVMNRNDLTEDGMLARFHAIDKAGVDRMNLFLLPANDEWLPYLSRWLTNCKGCGSQTSLGCYDLSVKCDGENSVEGSNVRLQL